MEERIKELLALIDTQLAMDVSDPVTESYKARNLENYSRSLINLLNARKLFQVTNKPFKCQKIHGGKRKWKNMKYEFLEEIFFRPKQMTDL